LDVVLQCFLEGSVLSALTTIYRKHDTFSSTRKTGVPGEASAKRLAA
jgi:hypothetical protein